MGEKKPKKQNINVKFIERLQSKCRQDYLTCQERYHDRNVLTFPPSDHEPLHLFISKAHSSIFQLHVKGVIKCILLQMTSLPNIVFVCEIYSCYYLQV
jgi:hypothetical protein